MEASLLKDMLDALTAEGSIDAKTVQTEALRLYLNTHPGMKLDGAISLWRQGRISLAKAEERSTMKPLSEWAVGSSAEQELLEQCRDAVRELVPDVEVVLYGSRARGEAGPESDYDLLVLVDKPVDWQLEDHIRRRLYRLQLESGAVVSINAYNRAEWHSPLYRAMPFHHRVEYEGIVL